MGPGMFLFFLARLAIIMIINCQLPFSRIKSITAQTRSESPGIVTVQPAKLTPCIQET